MPSTTSMRCTVPVTGDNTIAELVPVIANFHQQCRSALEEAYRSVIGAKVRALPPAAFFTGGLDGTFTIEVVVSAEVPDDGACLKGWLARKAETDRMIAQAAARAKGDG